MPGTDERVEEFHRLHRSGTFVVPNPWDAGTARALQQLGAFASTVKILGSYPVAVL